MSQAAFLRQFDAAALAVFRTAGLADSAVYTPVVNGVAGAPVPCSVMVDRDVQDFGAGDLSPVSVPQTVVSFQRAELEPAAGGLVVVVGYPGTLRLIHRVRHDESLSVWEVEHAQSA